MEQKETFWGWVKKCLVNKKKSRQGRGNGRVCGKENNHLRVKEMKNVWEGKGVLFLLEYML